MRTPIGFRYSHTIGLLAQSGRGFSLPVDCALGPDGVLYVLNRGTPLQRNVHVTICTTAGDYRADFGAYGTGDGQFIRPTAIAVDREGDVYVSAESEHCIQKFSPTGISSIRFFGNSRGHVFLRKQWVMASQGEAKGAFVHPPHTKFPRVTEVYTCCVSCERLILGCWAPWHAL